MDIQSFDIIVKASADFGALVVKTGGSGSTLKLNGRGDTNGLEYYATSNTYKGSNGDISYLVIFAKVKSGNYSLEKGSSSKTVTVFDDFVSYSNI